MAIDVVGREKPVYQEGDRVAFDVGGVKGEGIIRGKAIEHIVDFWIVEMTTRNVDHAAYPYSCASLPHSALARLP